MPPALMSLSMTMGNLSWRLLMAMAIATSFLSYASAYNTDAGAIVLESFQNPQHKWSALNDPVMGGRSKGTLTIENGRAHFKGNVAIVPSLQAPGFITIRSRPFNGINPDISSCNALTIELQAYQEYSGYRISFGNAHVPGGRFAFGYKSDMPVSVEKGMHTLTIPFTNFTDNWDDATGDPKVTCQEDSRYCPSLKALHNVQTISVWGEGVEGIVDLEIKSIGASGCAADAVKDAAEMNWNVDEETIEEASAENLITSHLHKNGNSILIEDFENPSLTWSQKNDPVMGGESTGTFQVRNGVGVFQGQVKIVPFLQAPGFIKVQASGDFPDVSSCSALALQVMATEPYKGFRVSFGLKSAPGSMKYIRGFKSDMTVVADGSFHTVHLMFEDFTDNWDPATGDAVVTCQEDAQFCPDLETLRDIKQFSILGEGVAGKVELYVRTIHAVNCTAVGSPLPTLSARLTSVPAIRTEMAAPLGLLALAILISVSTVAMALRRRSRRLSQVNYEEIQPSNPEGSLA